MIIIKQLRDELSKTIIPSDATEPNTIKRDAIFSQLGSMQTDVLSFGLPPDTAKNLASRFCKAFSLSDFSIEVLHEKIDCFGKTAEEIKEIQEEKKLQFS